MNPMNADILNRVRLAVADLFNLPPDRVTAQTSQADVEEWDSLQHLNLVLALQQEFQVQINPEEMEKINSVETAVKIVQEKLGISS